jgi:hypothetical protein
MWITNPAREAELRIDRPPVKGFSQLVISVRESKLFPTNILDAFVKSSLVNALAHKFRIPGVLTTIEFLFAFSERPQMDFNVVGYILSELMKEAAPANVYLQLYRILSAVTYHDLQVAWIEKLLLNFALWKRCNSSDFQFILRHWATVLVNSFSAIFEERHYFSTLFNLYEVFFCGQDATEDGSFGLASGFGDGYDSASVRKCRELFGVFLVKVGSVSLTPGDLSFLTANLGAQHSREALLDILAVILDLSPFLSVGIGFAVLFSLMRGDPDVDELIVRIIHASQSPDVYGQIVALTERIEDATFFDRLLSSYPQFPKLMPLLCLLSVKFDRIPALAGSLSETPAERPSDCPIYFFFPLIPLFNAPDSVSASALSRFLFDITRPEDLPLVVISLSFLRFATLRPDASLPSFLCACLSAEPSDEILGLCVDGILFPCDGTRFHGPLLAAFEQEGIEYAPLEDSRIPVVECVRTLADLDVLANMECVRVQPRFEYRLGSSDLWEDRPTIETILSVAPESPLKSLLLYFADRGALSEEQLSETGMGLEEMIQGRLADYADAMREFLPKLCRQLKEVLEVRKWAEAESMETFAAKTVDNIEHTEVAISSEWVRDSSLCASFVPMKMKWRTGGRRRHFSTAEATFECDARRIKQGKDTPINFALTKDAFVIDGVEVLVSNITYLFARTRVHGDTALELLLGNGKLILIDFAPIENARLIKLFEKVGMKTDRVVVKPPAEEVLADRWVKGYRSNFDYVTQLNFLAGLTMTEGARPIFPKVELESLLIEGNFEAAYQQRRDFEGPATSREIPAFADLSFGCKMNETLRHRRLFEDFHPKKSPVRSEWPKQEVRQIVRGTSIAFCSLISSHLTRTTLNLISHEGESVRLEIDASQGLRCSHEIVCKIALSAPVFSSHKKNVFVYERKLMNVKRLHDTACVGESSMYSETNMIVCCDSETVVLCPTRTAVSMRSFDGIDKSLCYTESPITRLAVNIAYKMFAVSTLDGRVSLYSSRSGNKVGHVTFTKEVLEMVTTPKLGFVVAFTRDEVTIINVNGEAMKTEPFVMGIRKIFTFASEHDFDFVIVQTANNVLGFFEAFYPENFVELDVVPDEVIWAMHCPAITAFLVLTKTGSLRVIPQTLQINPL